MESLAMLNKNCVYLPWRKNQEKKKKKKVTYNLELSEMLEITEFGVRWEFWFLV